MATLNFGTTINLGTIANTLCVNNTTTNYSFSEIRSLSSSISTSGSISLSSLSNINLSLFKFPPSALDINSTYSTTGTTITNAREGNGGYFTSDSSELSTTHGSYNAFDGVFNNTASNFYASSLSFDQSNGAYTGANTVSGYSGESLTLQCPSKFVLKKYRVYPTNQTLTAPGVWRVYGSNNNNNWTLVHDQSARVTAGWTLGSYNEYSVDTNTHGSYRYYSFVVNQLSGNTGGSLNIAELECYGIPVDNLPLHSSDWSQTITISTAGSNSFSVVQSGSAPDVQFQLSSSGSLNTEVSVVNPTSSNLIRIPSRIQEYSSFTASFEMLATNASSHSVNFFVGSSTTPTITTGNIINPYSGFVTSLDMAKSKVSLINNSGVTIGSQISDSTWKNNVWYPVTVKYRNSTSGTWEINANNQTMIVNNTANNLWTANTASSYLWGIQTLTTSSAADSYIRRLNLKTSGERCFLSPGTYTFTVPSNITQLSCVCVGGGGGGGCGTGVNAGGAYGSGGGGCLSYATFNVTPDTTLRVVVGSGGLGGTSSSRNGKDGADSYVMLNSLSKEPSNALISNTGGTYIASASTEATAAYNAFDGDRGGRNYWSSDAVYNATTGNYTGTVSTTAGSTGYSGEWLQLQLPSPITLTNYTLFGRADASNSLTYMQTRTPSSFAVLGSNDGTTWALIDQQSGLTTNRPKQFTVTTNPSSYSYYRMVISVLGNAGTTRTNATIGEWELNTSYYALAKGGYGGNATQAGLGGYIISSISDGGFGSGGNGVYYGTSAGGGGGAGGYTGVGGNGNNITGGSGSGGGAGGGGRVGTGSGSGGGGVGIFGNGASGSGGNGGNPGSGGDKGVTGVSNNTVAGDGGLFGGGGGTPDDATGATTRGGNGAGGAVRLYW